MHGMHTTAPDVPSQSDANTTYRGDSPQAWPLGSAIPVARGQSMANTLQNVADQPA